MQRVHLSAKWILGGHVTGHAPFSKFCKGVIIDHVPTVPGNLALPCLGPSSCLRIGGHRHKTPRISTRFCLLHVEHNPQRVFLPIVWYHQSNVSVVFLDVCFRRWYRVGYVCMQVKFEIRGLTALNVAYWFSSEVSHLCRVSHDSPTEYRQH